MSEDLKSIEIRLGQAMNLTLQGTYHRRAPSEKALPLLEESRSDLEMWIEKHGENAVALRLLALANEALLNYEAASRLLRKAIELSPKKDRKDLKRLAAYSEAIEMFSQIKLSGFELVSLGIYLRGKLLDSAPERSLRWTERWLNEKKPGFKSSVIASLVKMGYSSDFAVLHNLVAG